MDHDLPLTARDEALQAAKERQMPASGPSELRQMLRSTLRMMGHDVRDVQSPAEVDELPAADELASQMLGGSDDEASTTNEGANFENELDDDSLPTALDQHSDLVGEHIASLPNSDAPAEFDEGTPLESDFDTSALQPFTIETQDEDFGDSLAEDEPFDESSRDSIELPGIGSAHMPFHGVWLDKGSASGFGSARDEDLHLPAESESGIDPYFSPGSLSGFQPPPSGDEFYFGGFMDTNPGSESAARAIDPSVGSSVGGDNRGTSSVQAPDPPRFGSFARLHLVVMIKDAEKLAHEVFARYAERVDQVIDDRIEEKLNYEAHLHAAQMRALDWR